MFNPQITFAPSPAPSHCHFSYKNNDMFIDHSYDHFESNCFVGKKLKPSEAVPISVIGLVHHQGPAPDQAK